MNAYDCIVNKLKNDDRVLSCALGGSRSRFEHSKGSDYDIFCIISDRGFASFRFELATILETIDPIKMAVYAYYLESRGYIFKALSYIGESFDISIISESRVIEITVRSTNFVIFDKNGLYTQLINEAVDSLYDKRIIQEQKKNDFLRMFSFEKIRFSKAVKASDYWYAIRSLERLKTYYILYVRAFLKIPSKSDYYPEKGFDLEVDSQLAEKYYIDGTIETAKSVNHFLTQELIRIASDKDILFNTMIDKCTYPKKMKITLIDMEYERAELNEPINVYTLLQCLSAEVNANVEISVVYRENKETNQLANIDNTDVILISSKVSSENKLALLLENFKKKPVVLGGVIATHKYHEIVSAYENVICSIGEGETNLDTILRYFIYYKDLQNIKHALEINNIPNLYFKLDDRYVFTTRKRHIVIEKDSKPLLHPNIEKIISNNGLVRIEGSRGCPWNACSFCVIKWKYPNGNWTGFPVNTTVEEIANLSNQGVKTLYFTDEDFLGSKSHINNLFSLIIEHKKVGNIDPKMKFWGSTSVFTLLKLKDSLNQCLQLIKDSGVEGLFVGIESGSDSQLQRFNKGVSAKDNSYILSVLKSFGFIVDVGFIMFDPEVTMDEIANNMIFIRENKLDLYSSRLAKELRLVSHTCLFEKYKASGLSMKNNGLVMENYYDFINSDVCALVNGIRQIDQNISDKTDLLQATMRGDTKKWHDDVAQEIVFLRNIEYAYIDSCLEYYKLHGKLSDQVALSISEKIITHNKGRY